MRLVFLIHSSHLAFKRDGPGWYDLVLTHAADMNVTALRSCKASQICAYLNNLI